MKPPLISKIEKYLNELNNITNFRPSILDHPKKDNVTVTCRNKKIQVLLKKLEKVVEKLENNTKIKHRMFLIGQLSSTIFFLQNFQRVKFKEILKDVFGVSPVLNISSIINRLERRILKELKDLDFELNEWKKCSSLKVRNKREFKVLCQFIIDTLKCSTLQKFKILDVKFEQLHLISKPLGINWFYFLKRPTLLIDQNQKNLYILTRNLAHETFPGHYFIGNIRRQLYGDMLIYRLVYSPLASFEEGMAEYLSELLLSNKSKPFSVAHQLAKLKYAYCYKAVEILFRKKENSVKKFLNSSKLLNKKDMSSIIRFVEENGIYAAIYTPSYLFIRKICKKYLQDDPKNIVGLLRKLIDMKLLKSKYL